MGLINSIATGLELGRVRRMNARAKGVNRAGRVTAEELVACEGNALVACKDDALLAHVVAGRCAAYVGAGWPVVVLHEGNDALVASLRSGINAAGGSILEVDGRSCFYEPLLGLSSGDAASLLFRAAESVRSVPDDMLSYLRVLTRVLEARGYATYVRMVEGCPHARIHEVIAKAEGSGALAMAEAASMRSDVDASPSGRAAAQGFLGNVVSEGGVLPSAAEVSRSVSVASFVRAGGAGVLCIDLGASAGQSLVSVVLTEVEDLVRSGQGMQLVLAVDTVGTSAGEKLASSSANLGWVVAVSDMARAFAKPEGLARVVASCERTTVFSQGLQASEMVSALLGEYEKQDATVMTGGHTMRNTFGHGSVSVTARRERVVQPEEIRGLRDGEFFLLDARAGILKGRVS